MSFGNNFGLFLGTFILFQILTFIVFECSGFQKNSNATFTRYPNMSFDQIQQVVNRSLQILFKVIN